MVLTDLHWVDGPWPGRLALAARPRGGEWLGDEMAQWRSEGVDMVVSLLESSEAIKRSLAPGQEHCLKTRPDGTMPDGHHRVHVRRGRGEDVDESPREVLRANLGGPELSAG